VVSTQPDQPTASGSNDRPRRLVLVTGAGRSGTSTIAGALHHLGFYVPQPVLKKNASNPRGFFESTWPVAFHKRILGAAVVEQTDGRFEAAQMVHDAVTPAHEDELRGWLAKQFDISDRVMVKDPRSAWAPLLWQRVAASLDADTGFVTMLREPAEVLGSRSTYYESERDKWGDWAFKVKNLCGWININLVVEQATRGQPRVWLRYADLLSDWRPRLRRVRDDLGLAFDFDLDAPDAKVLDEFIDPTLRRHRLSLADLDMPAELTAIAEQVWAAGSALADEHDADAGGAARFDHLTARYEKAMRDAEAMAHHAMLAQVKRARRKTERETRTKVRAELRAAAAAQKAAPPVRLAPAKPGSVAGPRPAAVRAGGRVPPPSPPTRTTATGDRRMHTTRSQTRSTQPLDRLTRRAGTRLKRLLG
jgi:hypothetical protein